MEEILSSIKRIIAEEEAPVGRRRGVRAAAAATAMPDVARTAPPEPAPAVEPEPEEVLELSDPMPPAQSPQADIRIETSPEPARPAPEPVRPAPVSFAPAHAQPTEAETILSPAAADATRGALESLSRLMVKPEPHSDGTLESLVREMLRPMLREWLDTHLPDMVEALVAREIARISGQTR